MLFYPVIIYVDNLFLYALFFLYFKHIFLIYSIKYVLIITFF